MLLLLYGRQFLIIGRKEGNKEGRKKRSNWQITEIQGLKCFNNSFCLDAYRLTAATLFCSTRPNIENWFRMDRIPDRTFYL